MKRFLSILPFFFAAPDDQGGAPAASAPAPAAEPVPEPVSVEPPAASAPATLEERLVKAETDVSNLRDQLAARADQVKSLTGERDSLKAQCDALTTEATGLRDQVAESAKQITALTGERDGARAELTAARSNVERLEKLCGIKGIDPAAAVPSAGPLSAAPVRTRDTVAAEIRAETDPAKRAELVREFNKLP